MYVETIVWISGDGQEAEVKVTAGGVSCWAFAQPCALSVGDIIEEPLHAFATTEIMIAPHMAPGIWEIAEGSLQRRVVAEFIDRTRGLFRVGDFEIIVDEYLPGGLDIGANVEFQCARIDIW